MAAERSANVVVEKSDHAPISWYSEKAAGCVPESVSALVKWWAGKQQAVEQAQARPFGVVTAWIFSMPAVSGRSAPHVSCSTRTRDMLVWWHAKCHTVSTYYQDIVSGNTQLMPYPLAHIYRYKSTTPRTTPLLKPSTLYSLGRVLYNSQVNYAALPCEWAKCTTSYSTQSHSSSTCPSDACSTPRRRLLSVEETSFVETYFATHIDCRCTPTIRECRCFLEKYLMPQTPKNIQDKVKTSLRNRWPFLFLYDRVSFTQLSFQ